MIKCIIIDLDGTLVYTSALEEFKTQRRWREIPDHLHLCTLYKEVVDVLDTARAAGIQVGIFTNSPKSTVVNHVLKYFNIFEIIIIILSIVSISCHNY